MSKLQNKYIPGNWHMSHSQARRATAGLLRARDEIGAASYKIYKRRETLLPSDIRESIAKVESAIQTCEVWCREMRELLPGSSAEFNRIAADEAARIATISKSETTLQS